MTAIQTTAATEAAIRAHENTTRQVSEVSTARSQKAWLQTSTVHAAQNSTIPGPAG